MLALKYTYVVMYTPQIKGYIMECGPALAYQISKLLMVYYRGMSGKSWSDVWQFHP